MGQKFRVFFTGYLSDLYGTLGMAVNALIRKAVGGKVQSAYIEQAEAIDVEKLKEQVLLRIARLLYLAPMNKRAFDQILAEVKAEWGPRLDALVEEHRVTIAEIQFLGEPEKAERRA